MLIRVSSTTSHVTTSSPVSMVATQLQNHKCGSTMDNVGRTKQYL